MIGEAKPPRRQLSLGVDRCCHHECTSLPGLQLATPHPSAGALPPLCLSMTYYLDRDAVALKNFASIFFTSPMR